MATPIENLLQPEPIGHGMGGTESSRVDASIASPVLILTGLSLGWLLVASALQLIVSWKLHAPGFLADFEWFTYGRVDAAQSTAFIYGWASSAGLAVAFWLSSRLAGSVVLGGNIVGVAGVFWSIGVAVSVVGILSGDATGLPGFEIPRYAAPILFVSLVVVCAWIVQTVKAARTTSMFASQWFIVAALFTFAWLFSVAQVTLLFFPVRGTLQAIVQSWYSGGLFLLWLMPIGISIIYYLVPKLGGRALSSYYLCAHGFWWLLMVGGFVGVGVLSGGPVPSWVQAAGVAGGLMLLIPAFAILYPLFASLGGALRGLKFHPSGRFVLVGIVCLAISLVWSSVAPLAVFVKFSLVSKALTWLGLYGFISMSLFAGIYYFVPKTAGVEWSRHGLIDVHFWSSLLGFLLSFNALVAVGLRQSSALADSKVALSEVIASSSGVLFAASCGVMLTTIGHIAFSLGFVGVLLKSCLWSKLLPTLRSEEATAR